MKNASKLLSLFIAAIMIATLSLTVAADNEVTVTVPDSTHTYAAYQIFSGTQETSGGPLASIQWGSGINSSAFLTALKSDTSGPFNVTSGGTTVNIFADCVTAQDVADVLDTVSSNSQAAELFAKLAFANKSAVSTTLSSGTNTLDKGYYLVVDTQNVSGTYDVANPAVLMVTNDMVIEPKTDKPSVDKQVWDEAADSEDGVNNWGESADHALNETFQFKLIGTLPVDIEFDRYETYTVKFNDFWSEGITFENLVSVDIIPVKASAETVSLYTGGTIAKVGGVDTFSYTVDTTARTLTITVPDVKTLGADLSEGASIVVVYNAHLNESAIITNADTVGNGTADDNINTVNLEYTNTPDTAGTGTTLGKTPDDTVFVFTYEILNTKYKDSKASGNELGGAEFKLYQADGVTEIPVIYDSTLGGYRLTKGAETGETMVSASGTGVFNIIGLDTGTYVLKETKAPDGYNVADDIQIVISATHLESGTGTSATVSFVTDSTHVDNDIIDKSGNLLPTTGGVGTKMIYIIGALLTVGAGVFLIVKKKIRGTEAAA